MLNPIRLQTDMGWPPHPTKGPYSFYYKLLSEPELSSELSRLSHATSETLSSDKEHAIRVDSLSFQPCGAAGQENQDRMFTKQVGSEGLLMGVFDGHAGHATVDHAENHLPSTIVKALSIPTPQTADPAAVISKAITSFDNSIGDDVVNLFPTDPSEFAALSSEEIAAIVNDTSTSLKDEGLSNHAKIMRAMSGTTALVVYVEGTKLWIANLGDTQAVVGTKVNGVWYAGFLTSNHNGDNPSEVTKVKSEHPADEEDTVMENNRVLGAIAVTRALGDHLFKFPPQISGTFLHSITPFSFTVRTPQSILERSKTAPYVSNVPEVYCLDLAEFSKEEKPFLILCSDGLVGEYPRESSVDEADEGEVARIGRVAQHWVEYVGGQIDAGESPNLAVGLLRQALESPDFLEASEEDRQMRLSRMLTLESEKKWTDDITVMVIRF